MFTRLKWFVFGSAATIGVGAFLAGKVKRARERLSTETMARAGASTVAGMMSATGRRMQRSGSADDPGSVDAGPG